MRTNSSSSGPELTEDKPPARTVNEDLLVAFEHSGKPIYRLYEPRSICLVLGAGRKVDEDVFVERARSDGIAVRRRRGGGGTVVLTPGQVVLALVAEVASPFNNQEYFRIINGWFRRALEGLGVRGVEDRGISDLAINERKILGTSLYRRRSLLFYQASLLVDLDLDLFERYLPFPSRVPDYRERRTHRDFCTTLRREGCEASLPQVLEAVRAVVDRELPLLR